MRTAKQMMDAKSKLGSNSSNKSKQLKSFENSREVRFKNETLRRSTERRPLRMHSLRPVPSTITSYSSSMAIEKRDEAQRDINVEMNDVVSNFLCLNGKTEYIICLIILYINIK